MATDKKHIAVYLDKAVENALTAFCIDNSMESKKGPMYSAAVNKALLEFFEIESNTPGDMTSNTSDDMSSNTPDDMTNNTPSNIPEPEAKLIEYLTRRDTPLSERFNAIDEKLERIETVGQSLESTAQQEIKQLREDVKEVSRVSGNWAYMASERLEKVEELGKKLEENDALLVFKNNEIKEASDKLAAERQIVVEANEQIERKESELRAANEQIKQLESELAAAVVTKISEFPRPAELVGLLRIERPKLKISQIDITAIYNLLNKQS